ncbi:MAG: hypothetical protein HOQ05_08360 [Corynebacteriales bacterium]|nr:hypothetical protein [Mycobacteriales bacterium]
MNQPYGGYGQPDYSNSGYPTQPGYVGPAAPQPGYPQPQYAHQPGGFDPAMSAGQPWQQVPQYPGGPVGPPPQGGGAKTALVIISIVALVVVLGGGGGLALYFASKDDESSGGGGTNSDNPTAVVEQYADAIIAQDIDDIMDLSCEEDRAEIDEDDLDTDMKLDVKFTVTDEEEISEDHYEVKYTVKGEATVDGETHDIDDDGVYPVIKEDGKWVVCNSEGGAHDSSVADSGTSAAMR